MGKKKRKEKEASSSSSSDDEEDPNMAAALAAAAVSFQDLAVAQQAIADKAKKRVGPRGRAGSGAAAAVHAAPSGGDAAANGGDAIPGPGSGLVGSLALADGAQVRSRDGHDGDDEEGGEPKALDLMQLRIAAALDKLLERQLKWREKAAKKRKAAADDPGAPGGEIDGAGVVRFFRHVPPGTPCILDPPPVDYSLGWVERKERHRREVEPTSAKAMRKALPALAVDGQAIIEAAQPALAAATVKLPAQATVLHPRPFVPHEERMEVLLGRKRPQKSSRGGSSEAQKPP